jgi:uridine kinase
MMPAHTSFLIGLAGGSASGKSTFTGSLIDALRSAHPALIVEKISTDDYFLPHERMPSFYSPTRGLELPDYNHPDSLDAAALLRDIAKRCTAPASPDVLLIEGLMVLHLTKIREQLDLRLFIELDPDQRALRRLVRNLGHTYDPLDDNSAGSIANYFLESAKVGHEKYVEPSRRCADFIFRGDGDFGRTAPMIALLIVAMVEKKRSGL